MVMEEAHPGWGADVELLGHHHAGLLAEHLVDGGVNHAFAGLLEPVPGIGNGLAAQVEAPNPAGLGLAALGGQLLHPGGEPVAGTALEQERLGPLGDDAV